MISLMLKSPGFNQVKSCLICHNKNFRTWATTSYKKYLDFRPDLQNDTDPIKKQPSLYTHQILLKQCVKCDFIFSALQITSEALSKLYEKNSSYYSHYADEITPAMQALIASYRVEIQNLEKIKNGGKLLEIGCSGGLLLSLLGKQWEITGVDIDKNAITAARKRLGKRAQLIYAPLHKANLPNGTFDVVLMRAVLEHIPDPRSFLQIANQLLKPGGLVAITVPNISSLCGQLYKEYFRMVDPIHHIWYFSPKTLKLLLTSYDFKIDKITYNYFNTPYFHPKDILLFTKDWLIFQLSKQKPMRASPPFYGSLMDVYAHKEL